MTRTLYLVFDENDFDPTDSEIWASIRFLMGVAISGSFSLEEQEEGESTEEIADRYEKETVEEFLEDALGPSPVDPTGEKEDPTRYWNLQIALCGRGHQFIVPSGFGENDPASPYCPCGATSRKNVVVLKCEKA